ncbi:MerR family transcriptional regulator [Alcanivorax sp. S71-1-4]|uniref:MerR family transcriptional regulator n=1 Tax=Alcanivorax sp. S71-1-4 TaxID=1177159 RepID=UPI00135B4424|nr:MerR family transcriptional regulator [Alcanivorax sp. S71-1-4]KAF0810224.1 MerR family transcriptional regulator [Alcanivorax sp. S71-1-4]
MNRPLPAADPTRVPISRLSELTGVNPVTLRAWERRYGLLRPQRTDKGHRLYSEEDVQRVHNILDWLNKGVAISRVRPLLAGDAGAQVDADWQALLAPAIKALTDMDPRRLEQHFNRVAAEYPLEQVVACWVTPLMTHARLHMPGEPGAAGMLHGFLRARLGIRQWQAARRDGRAARVLVMSLGSDEDLAVLMQTALLLENGVPALSLSALPEGDQIRLLAAQASVRALLLVLSPGLTRTALRRRLGAAPRHLPVPLFVCGGSVPLLVPLPEGVQAVAGDYGEVARGLLALLPAATARGEVNR